MQKVLGKYLVVNPVVRQGRVFKGVAELLRGPIGGVGIPVVHVHKPVVLLSPALQPVQHPGGYLPGQLVAAFAEVHTLVKAGVEPPGGVALGKGGEADRVQPRPPKLHEQAVLADSIPKVPGLPLQAHIRSRAAVAHHPGAYAVAPGDKGGPAGQAGGVWAVVVVKTQTVGGHAVNGRGGIPQIAVAAQVVRAQGIDVEHDYTHRRTLLLGNSPFLHKV